MIVVEGKTEIKFILLGAFYDISGGKVMASRAYRIMQVLKPTATSIVQALDRAATEVQVRRSPRPLCSRCAFDLKLVSWECGQPTQAVVPQYPDA